MKRVITIATAALTLLMAPAMSIAGQMPDTMDKTIMTFSNAVELPRLKLEAGTYIFRISDTPGRDVVQVLTEDGKSQLGQWLFMPVQRAEPTGDTVVTFRETSAVATPAIQSWYYPGRTTGREFIYSKEEALEIARRTGASVLTDSGRVSASDQIAPAPQAVAARVEPAVAPVREPRAVETQNSGALNSGRTPDMQMASASPANMQQESTAVRSELPSTASRLPLGGLIALLSLAGAAGIRRFRHSEA